MFPTLFHIPKTHPSALSVKPLHTNSKLYMADLAKRFPQNPLLSPSHLKPSLDGLRIACLLNPGVFKFEGKTWLLVRVAERPEQTEVVVSFPISSPLPAKRKLWKLRWMMPTSSLPTHA
jgi:hypothetical protein